MGSLEVGNQSPEFIREKVSLFRAFVLGKGYVEVRANDAEKIHGLGFNAFIVSHRKLGTFSFGTTPKKVSEATGHAIAAAKDYAEWRKDMVTYTTYDNVDAAIASMRDEKREALIKSAKEDIGSYLRKNPKEGGIR
ncbi:hypothetical protein PNK_1612 [Candidatus Protochlamydia naegleriophila]|uniref:Uncharacterized protein n=2 Tax=Candidatus Protochlamydia naegleriophila TaxID=389348 RepID=A0A0U5JH03_9BACT|nr:hypothetical protein PNK_1612 [Candidatus Protochlamydia naegleriophila]